jgi:hypothetical protein
VPSVGASTETNSYEGPRISPTLSKIKADGIFPCSYFFLLGLIYRNDDTGEITDWMQ